MKNLSVAVVGTGFIGPVHVEALKRAGLHVKGILGSNADKSRSAADKLGLETGYSTLNELVSDREVQAVHITTPNRYHAEQVKQCLAAGKHVMCEKPLAMTTVETKELTQLAARSNRACGVAYNIRSYPLCREARERIARGELGEIFHVEGSYVQDWLLEPTDFNWRVLSSEGGELRALADIGTHWLDLVQSIVGKQVISLFASLKTVHPIRRCAMGSVETFQAAKPESSKPVEIDTEDCGSVLLRFEGGTIGNLWVSQVTAGFKNCLRFEIAGAKASLAFDSQRPSELFIGHRHEPNQIVLRDPSLLSPAARALADYPGGHNEGFPDTFKQLFKEFYRYVSEGDFSKPAPFPTFADGHREVALCEVILKSHKESRWIDVVD